MDTATAIQQSPLPAPSYDYHFSEFIGIGDDGHLWVEGRDCVELAETFGTPLYVISENQLRHNYRRFRDAFLAEYSDVEILFANKSNNGLAIRHIMNQEGAGGDCFGYNEMYLALLAGSDPNKMALNGSNKEPNEIELAVANGVCINIDAMDELDMVHATAQRLGKTANVGVRVKLELPDLEDHYSTGVHKGNMAEIVQAEKWGMPYSQAVELVRRIRDGMNDLVLHELHFHLSRLDNQAESFALMARDMVRWAARLRDDTGWIVPCIDLGGGWTFGRKEKTGPRGGIDDERVSSFEDYGREVARAVKQECEVFDLPLPKLRIEPGRAISGTAGISIGRVGAVKEWPEKGLKWVNLDLSGNHVPWITIPHHYHIVPVNKARDAAVETVEIVGPICTHDILGRARQMPVLVRGDLVALLDTGCYAESTSANFNAQCRPATVLVSGKDAEVTTERERLNDVVGRFRVPSRLLGASQVR
jgi:diaminopimelate decarboxylase